MLLTLRTLPPQGMIVVRFISQAAANLFRGHSLHALRYLQNSLRMQVHHLLGYDPSTIYRTPSKSIRVSSDVFRIARDISIVGDNNHLYRGQIHTCEISSAKATTEKKSRLETSTDDQQGHERINFDPADPISASMTDQHLFEYLDWQLHFNEQVTRDARAFCSSPRSHSEDLPNPLCDELFLHWKSLRCEQQPCDCEVENAAAVELLPPTDSEPSESERCVCSCWSGECEKHPEREELVSSEVDGSAAEKEADVHLAEQTAIAEDELEEEVPPPECFVDHDDQRAQPFDLPISRKTECTSTLPDVDNRPQFARREHLGCVRPVDLDDPTMFRQRLLDRHRQHSHTD